VIPVAVAFDCLPRVGYTVIKSAGFMGLVSSDRVRCDRSRCLGCNPASSSEPGRAQFWGEDTSE